MEKGKGGDFLVDEHKVHGPFRQMGRNNKVHREKAATKKQFDEILMGYIYWQATRTSSSLRGLRGERESLRLTDNHWVQRYMRMTCTHRHRNTLIHALVKLWRGRSKDNPSHTSRGHREQSLCVFWECQRHEKNAYMWLRTYRLHNIFFLSSAVKTPHLNQDRWSVS